MPNCVCTMRIHKQFNNENKKSKPSSLSSWVINSVLFGTFLQMENILLTDNGE